MPAALFMARTKSLIRIATELMRSRQGISARPAEITGGSIASFARTTAT